MPVIEERVSNLEKVLEEFIKNVGIEFNKLYNAQMRTEIELRKFKDEMKDFKDEMKVFKDEMKDFKDEMKVFKDEMKDFKDEMKMFKDEMKDFKDEMKVFKDEMKDFKDEMKVFKDETVAFREEMKEESRRKNKEWSNLAKKMGTIVEDLIAPALRPVIAKYFDCEVRMEGQRMYKRTNGNDYEVDAIAACEDKIFMIEVKSTPRIGDIDEIRKKSKMFFEFFPEYEGKELIIIFGSITFPENVISYASNNGIYVMAWREWEYMDILNFNEIKNLSRS